MLLCRILVADQAVDRLYLFLVRNILSIESRVARDARKLAMNRFVKNTTIDTERDLFSFSLHRQRRIAMTSKALLTSLRINSMHRQDENAHPQDQLKVLLN